MQDYTRCPDCAAPLTGSTCGRCGLGLDGDDGIRLAEASDAVAAALGRHDDLVIAVRGRQGLTRPGEDGSGWRVAEVLPDPARWQGSPDRWAPAAGQAWRPAGRESLPGGVVPPSVGPSTGPHGRPRTGPITGPSTGPNGGPSTGPDGRPRTGPDGRPGTGPSTGPNGGRPRADTGAGHPDATPPSPRTAPVAAPTSAPVDLAAAFALAGSALFAVAALVFAFFLVDDDPMLRSAVLIVSTGISAAGTALLGRRGLRSSAQAVAWLTVALTVVDCWVLALLAHGTARPLVAAGAFTLAIGGGVALGRRTGLRAWSALIVLSPVVPLLLGAATDDLTGIAVGVAVAAATTLVRRPFRERVAPHVGARSAVESVLLVSWAVVLLAWLPLLVTGAISRYDPGSSAGMPVSLLIGLGIGLTVTAVLTAAQGWAGTASAWAGVAGFLLVSAAATMAAAVPSRTLIPVAASLVWAGVLLGGGRRRHGRVQRAAVIGGGIAVLLSAVSVLEAVRVVLDLVAASGRADLPRQLPALVFGTGVDAGSWRALVAAGCLLALTVLVRRVALVDVEVRVPILPGQFRVERRASGERAVARVLAPVATLVAAAALPTLLRGWPVALLVAELLLAVTLVEVVRRMPRDRVWFPILLTGAFGQLLLVAALSWVSRPSLLAAGVLVPVLVLRTRRVTMTELVWLPTAVAVGYGATVLAVVLSWPGWSLPTVAGLVALVLLLAGIGLTGTRLDTGSWVSIWVVAAVPVLLVLTWSVSERIWAAGWTAMALAVAQGVVVTTRRRPVRSDLRAMAAAGVLPTGALGLINAGAMLLPGSAAPVLLPVIAVLSAGVALSAAEVGERLGRHGTTGVRRAAEWSALATGATTLLVALLWPTTAADTVLVVCALLAAGASVVATRTDRRHVWWLAAALWTGVLWTALVWGGVGVVEAYTVPPALLAIGVGAWLTRRAPGRWWPLVAAGLGLLVAPSLVLTAAGREVDVRAVALVVLAGVLVGLGHGARQPVLRACWGWAAGAAALAGPIRSLWWSAQTAVGSEARNAVVFGAALGWALAGGALLGVAGVLVARRARHWALAPALAVVTVAGLAAVRPTWTVVWVALAVEVALLALTVLSVPTATRSRRTLLPPAWFCWLIALAWAIGGWSLRELRVEAYALPLGIGLTLAGLLALRTGSTQTRSWPVGFSGSMATLAPGVAATLGPSLLAIWTDPVTWRAILVVVLCLMFMVTGARALLRAPLVIGAVTLALAVLSVFGTRLGSDISAGPWLLTLLAAGGLLLVLGIYAERRKPAEGEGSRALR